MRGRLIRGFLWYIKIMHFAFEATRIINTYNIANENERKYHIEVIYLIHE